MKTFPEVTHGLTAALWLASTSMALGQWATQTFELRPGWNGVFFHVDASHATLDDLVAGDAANPIAEVWQWNPSAPNAQFVQNPLVPADAGTPWSTWLRGDGASSALQRLSGNTAYLVRVEGGSAFTWSVKGRPVAPGSTWTTTGLNFVGFPTVPDAAPVFSTFLGAVPGLLSVMEVFRYPGGPLGAGNPVQVLALNTTPVRRGEAFWLRAGETFNRYFGPFEVVVPGEGGVEFAAVTGQYAIRLRNMTAETLTVTATWLDSEPPPAGQPAILGQPPLILRGGLNPTNLTYGYSDLAVPRSWTLQAYGRPGSEVEVVLGVNRSLMGGNPGDLFAGILRLTDSRGMTRIDVPVSATVASKAGLWVGAAAVDQVRHYLNTYERDGTGAPVLNSEGRYVIVSSITNLGTVARPYPLRLILHADAAGGSAKLLQRVYLGVKTDATVGLTTKESLLDPAKLESARRISAVHLPWSEANVPWNCAGALRPGTTLTTTIPVDYADDAANPFLHTYHPDHDNLNEMFEGYQARGAESYAVSREITLAVRFPDDNFASLTAGHGKLVGTYDEAITLVGKTKPGRAAPESRRFEVRGAFTLNRITEAPVLTTE